MAASPKLAPGHWQAVPAEEVHYVCYPDPRESHWAVTHRRLFAGLAFELDGHGCISNYNKSIEYYPGERRAIFGVVDGFAPAVATFATDFEIEYRKTYKILRNLLSHDVYVLRQCGTPAELQDLPAYAVGATVRDSGHAVARA